MGGRGSGSGMGKGLMTRFGTADTPSGYTVDDFRNLSDDDLVQFMDSVRRSKMTDDMPDFLNKVSNSQRLVYALGMNDTPQVVDDKTFQQLVNAGATPLYRSVNDQVYDWHRNNRAGTAISDTIPATDQLDMIAYGDTSYMGNGVAGDGLYFSDSLPGSKAYGNTTIKAVINPNTARSISIENLRKEYDTYMSQHRYRVRKAFKEAASQSYHGNSYTQFAIMRGYNIITRDVSGWSRKETYYTVIDRSALIVSDKYI